MLFLKTNTTVLDRGISETVSKQRGTYDLLTERMLLWFDLRRVPPGGKIYKATLILPVTGPTGNGVEVKVGRVIPKWDPLQATWAERDPSQSREWAEPGGKEGTDYSPWVGAAASIPPGTSALTPVYVSFDVADHVRLALARNHKSVGWFVAGTARIGGVRNAQLPATPALSIKYSGAQAAAIGAGLMSGGA